MVALLGLLLWVACLALVRGGTVGTETMLTVSWENFTLVRNGEWMLEFYAPWCPACQQFTSAWTDFGNQMAGTEVNVAKVDVTVETMLSGRFMVTHLPSVFHIKDGAVRQYEGERVLHGLVDYIHKKEWQEQDPIPVWRSPTAYHMYLVGTVFWLSERAKDMQTVLEKDYKLPTYAIFIVIAIATIVVGLILGGLTVCCIELTLRFFSRGQSQRDAKIPRPMKQTPTQGVTSSEGSEVSAKEETEVLSAGKGKEQVGGARKRNK